LVKLWATEVSFGITNSLIFN